MNETKDDLRTRIRAARQALSPSTKAWYDQSIRSQLTRMPGWSHARSVGLYLSLPEEPGTAALIDEGLRRGMIVALPKVEGEMMTYRRVESREELAPGAFGLMAPGDDAPILPPASLDLIVAPGVAFDRMGNRLGFGRGFFDKALADFEGALIGLAWPEMMVDRLPVDPWDKKMRQVIVATPLGAERTPTDPNALSRRREERR